MHSTYATGIRRSLYREIPKSHMITIKNTGSLVGTSCDEAVDNIRIGAAESPSPSAGHMMLDWPPFLPRLSQRRRANQRLASEAS